MAKTKKQSRKNGKFLVLRKTVRRRLFAKLKLKELKEELAANAGDGNVRFR